jgi:hypothetical protein
MNSILKENLQENIFRLKKNSEKIKKKIIMSNNMKNSNISINYSNKSVCIYVQNSSNIYRKSMDKNFEFQ